VKVAFQAEKEGKGLILGVLGIFSLTFVFVARQQVRKNSYFCFKRNTN
jgi:hypothetical protein